MQCTSTHGHAWGYSITPAKLLRGEGGMQQAQCVYTETYLKADVAHRAHAHLGNLRVLARQILDLYNGLCSDKVFAYIQEAQQALH